MQHVTCWGQNHFNYVWFVPEAPVCKPQKKPRANQKAIIMVEQKYNGDKGGNKNQEINFPSEHQPKTVKFRLSFHGSTVAVKA